MPCINFNGNIVPADTPVIKASFRGLRYGDGVFETMKWRNNSLLHAGDHFSRMFNGLRILNFVLPTFFTPEFLMGEISKTVKVQNLPYARVRLTVIKGNGNIFDLQGREPVFIIEVSKLYPPERSVKPGVTLGIFRDAKKSIDILSPLKHNNYLPYCLAATYAKLNGYDDALLLNQHARICETSIANFFLIKQKTVITPSLSEGCIEGVMRKNLLRTLPELGYEILETEVDEEMIENSGAAFITNSIINMKPVSSIGNRKLDEEPSFALKQFIERKTTLFC